MPQPNSLLGLFIWIVIIVVACVAAVFLFQNIIMPLVKAIS